MKEESLKGISREELALKLRDPKFYLEMCKIKTKNGGLAPFRLNNVQKDLFNTLKNNDKIIILKARQIGSSTGFIGYFYHYAITHPGINTAIIGYNMTMAAELFDKVKLFYRSTPAELRPTISEMDKNNRSEISFGKMESKILVLPSTKNVGRGYTIHNAIISELPMWEDQEEKMAAIQAAVPPGGKIVVESTPKSAGDKYHQMWVDNDNGYAHKEYGWWWQYTKEEIEQKRREMSPMLFAQEYELKFSTSGRCVFDQPSVEYHRSNILNVGDKVEYVDYDGSKKEFTVYKEGSWTFYKPPIKGHTYCGGHDVAEGVEGGDYSCSVIFDRANGEEVAFFHGMIYPDRFGEEICRIGRMYNTALAVIEHNNAGLLTINTVKKLGYPSIYYRQGNYDKISVSFTDRIGWRTDRITKPLMIGDMDKSFRDKSVIIHSKKILDETTTFVYDNNNDPVPMGTFHDDSISACAMAIQGFKVVFDQSKLGQIDYHNYLPRGFSY